MRAYQRNIGLLTVLCLIVSVFMVRDYFALRFHILACERAEEASYHGVGVSLFDRVRDLVGLPPRDDLERLAYHQQWLVNAGYLARRDLRLTNASGFSFIPTNLLQQLEAGKFATLWMDHSNHAVTVIAQPSRINIITQWIHEHDQ